MKIEPIIIIGALGWLWAIIQFFLKRRNVKKDKAVERRFVAYSTYMKKSDEIMKNLRTDSKMIYGFPNEFINECLKGDEESINEALLRFNSEIVEFTKKATQPILILSQELNSLKLVCSDELLPKIEEYKKLLNDYFDLAQIMANGSNDEPFGMKRFTELNNEILTQMRKEIGY